jgi:phage terminase large subunit-like protein
MERKTIKSIKRILKKPNYVYNISVKDNNNYFANGVLVHNCDDPNSVRDSESDTIRESTNDWHDFVMATRHAGTADQFRRLLIQQRTHARDVSGNVLAKEDRNWIHLRLPMEFEKAKRCFTIPLRMSGGKLWRDPRVKEGELLWPQGYGEAEVIKLKRTFRNDAYRISGQLQQSPAPAEGGIIKAKWFQKWEQRDLPPFEYILQSWDTALVGHDKKKSNTPAYSACSTWGIFELNGYKQIMFLSLFKERVEFPELRQMAVRLYENYYDTDLEDPLPVKYRGEHTRPHLVLIESKVSGYSLASELMRTQIPIMRFNPNTVGDKTTRAKRVTDLIENELVWLPTKPPLHQHFTEEAQVFLNDATVFPNGESNDTIDSMSQAFIRLKQTGWIYNKEDPQEEFEPDWKEYEKWSHIYERQWDNK